MKIIKGTASIVVKTLFVFFACIGLLAIVAFLTFPIISNLKKPSSPAQQSDASQVKKLPLVNEPKYKRYERVSEYSYIVEEAWKRHAYDGVPLKIYDPNLFEKVVVALYMLEQEAPYEYDLIVDSTDQIVEAKKTYAHNDVTYMKSDNVSASVLLTASTLYHEAIHHNQTLDVGRVDRELEAIEGEIYLMKDLEAPDEFINWLERQDGNHGDLDGDGRFTAYDFFKIDW